MVCAKIEGKMFAIRQLELPAVSGRAFACLEFSQAKSREAAESVRIRDHIHPTRAAWFRKTLLALNARWFRRLAQLP